MLPGGRCLGLRSTGSFKRRARVQSPWRMMASIEPLDRIVMLSGRWHQLGGHLLYTERADRPDTFMALMTVIGSS